MSDTKPNQAGPTGQYPNGRIGPDDGGELAIAVRVDKERNTLILHFGTPILWLGLTKAAALTIGNGLLKRAAELRDEPAPEAEAEPGNG